MDEYNLFSFAPSKRKEILKLDESEFFMDAIDLIENRVANNNQYPVIKNSKVKQLCIILFEFIKLIIYYIKHSINKHATKTESKSQK